MNTPLASRPSSRRTAFRNNVRPRLVLDQQHLSSLIVLPATVRSFQPDATAPADQKSSSNLLSTLDRSGWSFRVEHAVNEIIREHNARQQSTSVYSDLGRLFETTLDTVVIMASGQTPSEEHLLWSEAFLRGVRDSYGNHPPNVRKMLGFIRAIREKRGGADKSSLADASQLFVQTYQENVPANVTLTKIPPPTV